MEKKTRNILIIVICIVALLPLLLIILGLGGFILTDLFRSLSYDGAESFGNMLKYLGSISALPLSSLAFPLRCT